MTEMAKTFTFIALALVSLGAAFVATPSTDDFDVQAEVGKKLNQFDVEQAKRLRIVTFDKETASTRDFEVAEEDGLWVIPSKQGYPADAVRQMGAAATCLINREVLRIASKNAAQHAELGLVDPTASKLSTKAEGVGIRVTITDIDGSPLTDMVIGKKVPDTLDQYYVRNVDQDVAFVVNLDTKPLTTRFEEWIEKDLLKLNALDIERVHIKDYSAEFQPVLTAGGIQMQVGWGRRGEYLLRYDDSDSKWIAEELLSFNPDQGNNGEMVDFTLAEDEQLNEDALRELRYGLDDLVVVDVERKPSGLSADLKAGSDFLQDREATNDLISRGFGPVPIGNQLEILSSEGEIVCTLKDGVEYVLRFGNLQLDSEAGASAAEGASQDDPNAESDDGIHRYLFVMARFNESAIEKPELAELPELPVDAESEVPAETTADESEASESEPQAGEDAITEQAPQESADQESSEQESSETDAAEGEENASDEAEESELAKLIAEREEIEKENQRLLKEYQEKIDKAQETVQDLNERFGDWYYVIDNKVYQQIHLGRDDVIKRQEKEESDSDAEAADDAVPGQPNLPLVD